MAQVQHKTLANQNASARPTTFIGICVLLFVMGVSVIVYSYHSMAGEMEMPGGWTMTMMWMRMPGQTWSASGLSFLFMWLPMMVAMMLPSALPMFLRTKRGWISLCYMACGYFIIWLAAGILIYIPGVAVGELTMQSESFSRVVPFLLSAWLIVAGVIQFTRWKMTRLMRCRSQFGCATSCLRKETSFRLGCKQGAACCICCIAPMTIQLALGIMNSFVMIAVAFIIAAEKLFPRPKITACLVGIAAIVAGITTIIRSYLL